MRKTTIKRACQASYLLFSTVAVSAAASCIVLSGLAFVVWLTGCPVPPFLSMVEHGAAQVSVFSAAGAVLAERLTR